MSTTSTTSAVQLSLLPASSAAFTSASAVSSEAERARMMSAIVSGESTPCTPSLHSRKRSCRAIGWLA